MTFFNLMPICRSFFASSLVVALACGGVALLPVLDFVGGVFDERG